MTNENQKPVNDNYRKNWDLLFAKKITEKQFKENFITEVMNEVYENHSKKLNKEEK